MQVAAADGQHFVAALEMNVRRLVCAARDVAHGTEIHDHLLAQAVASWLANFGLLAPALAPPGILTNAAANAGHLTLSMLLLMLTGVFLLGVAITLLPVLRPHSAAMAIWLVAFATVGLAGLVLEGVALRAIVPLSQEYVKAGAADAGVLQVAGMLIRSIRNTAHYTDILMSGGTFSVFYGALFRFALVPRALGALGLFAVAMMIAGALIPLFGYPTVMAMFLPMGLSLFALAAWLLIKGFAERPA